MFKKGLAIFVAMFVLFSGFLVVKPVAAASVTKYVTATALNVRTGPGTTYKIVTTVKKNQAVTVSQTKGSWDKVTVAGKTGWASNHYLTTKNLAQGLNTVGSNKQLILVTSNGYNTSNA